MTLAMDLRARERSARRSGTRIDEGHVRTARVYAALVVVMSFLNAWHYLSAPVGVDAAGAVILYFVLGAVGLIGLLAFFMVVPRFDPSSTELDLDRDDALATVVAAYRVGFRGGFAACLLFLGFSAFHWEREGINVALDYKYHLVFWPLALLAFGALWMAYRYRNGYAHIAYEPLPGGLEEVFREMRDSYRKTRAATGALLDDDEKGRPLHDSLVEFQGAVDDLYEGAAALVRESKQTVALVAGFPADGLQRDIDRERAAGNNARVAALEQELAAFETLSDARRRIEAQLNEINATIRSAHLAVIGVAIAVARESGDGAPASALATSRLGRLAVECRAAADALRRERAAEKRDQRGSSR